MVILKCVDELLTHIKSVEENVIKLSNDSLMNMSTFMEENSLEIDDKLSSAFQYQDIITQQLSATIEAIDSMKSSMNRFTTSYESDESLTEQSMVKLQEKLTDTLEKAKDKNNRFSGKFSQDSSDDEIEFF
ncbi:hypothetical protein GJV85_09275 [Sulfurimonas aquatica]|uniref:Uncharacterized protein n=1 Tax=Sulfurimonas aquatica TaxID=2672570 RepID=A0A975B1B4_9BACT|nr:hypothetical protein [Sulfurimonas aquatica]QSZ42288.1 hypothetical protein GJV85_09275 [Sulfurimonas aquatica]